MALSLPALPFAKDALQPHMSAETFSFHYDKHHAAYVTNLNSLIEGTEFADMSLEDIILKSEGGIFNNAAQVWNHTFFWDSLSPNGGGQPSGKIAELIDRDLGSFENFKKEFATAGATQFGSGWAWLVQNAEGKLQVVKTANAENPMTQGLTPLLTMDVWEHAYYLDFQNARPKYIETFLNELVNWEFAEGNLG